jgi:uncharacterized protein
MATAGGFHEGEIAVQRRAGVRADAQRLEGMLDPADLSGGAGRFLALRTFAVMTGRDRDDALWISPLTGRPGFLDGADTVLRVGALPRSGDPLSGLPIPQQVGLLVIDFATRRRMRINGELFEYGDAGLAVSVQQAYGNCPQYIQQRALAVDDAITAAHESAVTTGAALSADDQRLVQAADTFFLGTSHPDRGSDASHRGGSPGFVRVDSPTSLWWPDYPGNNMFNSFGNLAVDDTAALLFADFDTGATVHLSGTARLEWSTPGTSGDDGSVGRRVHFQIRQVISGRLLGAHTDGKVLRYPHNPPLR